jgi:hypothetical protein
VLHAYDIEIQAYAIVVVEVCIMTLGSVEETHERMTLLYKMTWSGISRRQLPTQRSAMPFCQGD